MNILTLILALSAAMGQAQLQLNPCAAVDEANESYGPGRSGLVGCMYDESFTVQLAPPVIIEGKDTTCSKVIDGVWLCSVQRPEGGWVSNGKTFQEVEGRACEKRCSE